MCLIIDANVAHELCEPPSAECLPILQWMKSRKGQVAFGGTLAKELSKTSFGPLLLKLWEAGAAQRYDDDKLKAEEKLVLSLGIKSDDEHILALARLSGSRTLFSRDSDLGSDFVNLAIINPKGKVYKKQTHRHLLRDCKMCV